MIPRTDLSSSEAMTPVGERDSEASAAIRQRRPGPSSSSALEGLSASRPPRIDERRAPDERAELSQAEQYERLQTLNDDPTVPVLPPPGENEMRDTLTDYGVQTVVEALVVLKNIAVLARPMVGLQQPAASQTRARLEPLRPTWLYDLRAGGDDFRTRILQGNPELMGEIAKGIRRTATFVLEQAQEDVAATQWKYHPRTRELNTIMSDRVKLLNDIKKCTKFPPDALRSVRLTVQNLETFLKRCMSCCTRQLQQAELRHYRELYHRLNFLRLTVVEMRISPELNIFQRVCVGRLQADAAAGRRL